MLNIRIDVLGIKIDVNIPDRYDDFLVVKDEKYRPDRADFVYEAFKKAFPSINASDSTMVYKLASRSVKLNEWLAKTNMEYAQIQNEPTFYRDHISAKDYEVVIEDVRRVSKQNKDRAAAELFAAQKYKNEMDAISKKFGGLTFGNNFSKIVNLKSTQLPLSFQLAIENYTPAASTTVDRDLVKKAFAREVLVSYKVQLIKALNNDPKIDVDQLINESLEK